MISYLDTTAAMKLLVEEAESDALTAHLLSNDQSDRTVVASWLLHTELHCAASRHPDDIDRTSATTVLDATTLIDLARGDLLTARALPGRPMTATDLVLILGVATDYLPADRRMSGRSGSLNQRGRIGVSAADDDRNALVVPRHVPAGEQGGVSRGRTGF